MGVFEPVKNVIEAVDKLNPLTGGEQHDEQQTAEPAPAPAAKEAEQVRVARTEEELEVATTARQAGSVGVHKTVTTEQVHTDVPVRREQAHVERVPVDQPTEDAAIGEEVVRVPVYEEETVVTKRPVVKEEIRITKESQPDVEHIAENVRKEHVDVDHQPQSD